MPMYEYSCNKCGKTFEKLVRISDRDKQINCPNCGSDETIRLLSLFGVGGSGGSTKGSSKRSRGTICGSG